MNIAGGIRDKILDLILAERNRQDEKWGEQNHPDYYWLGILGEEFGEASKALIEGSIATYPPHPGDPTLNLIAQGRSTDHLEKELTQVAAVALAWLEAIQRRKA